MKLLKLQCHWELYLNLKYDKTTQQISHYVKKKKLGSK